MEAPWCVTAARPALVRSGSHRHSTLPHLVAHAQPCWPWGHHIYARKIASRAACRASASGVGTGGVDPNTPIGSLMQSFAQLQMQAQASVTPRLDGAALEVADLTYTVPGTGVELLQDINFYMPANKMGLLYGRSGAGKTTLLNVLAGLTEPTAGHIQLHPSSGDSRTTRHWTQAERRAATGMLFQFPERHFLGTTVLEELTIGWPTGEKNYHARQQLAHRMELVMDAVGLQGISLSTPPEELSGGYKRRLALAVQLVRGPRVLLMDEPLAGLDWEARASITQLLSKLKDECTLLVVSHDLKELLPIVDVSWQMLPGGKLKEGSN